MKKTMALILALILLLGTAALADDDHPTSGSSVIEFKATVTDKYSVSVPATLNLSDTKLTDTLTTGIILAENYNSDKKVCLIGVSGYDAKLVITEGKTDFAAYIPYTLKFNNVEVVNGNKTQKADYYLIVGAGDTTTTCDFAVAASSGTMGKSSDGTSDLPIYGGASYKDEVTFTFEQKVVSDT